MPPKDKDKKADPKKDAAPVEEEPEHEAFGQWDGERNSENLPFGKGKATYPNGDTYDGIIKNNMREEKGLYTWKAPEEGKPGGSYEGGYESNKKHGRGIMKYPDGGVYEGNWEEGLRVGQGTFKYPNGDWYKGMWSGGKKSGIGTYFSYAGSCWYVGTWLEGEFKEGEWKFKDGSCYKGNFKNGRPAPGDGVFLFPNGNKQVGKWVEAEADPATVPPPAAGAPPPQAPPTNIFWVGGELIVGQSG